MFLYVLAELKDVAKRLGFRNPSHLSGFLPVPGVREGLVETDHSAKNYPQMPTPTQEEIQVKVLSMLVF